MRTESWEHCLLPTCQPITGFPYLLQLFPPYFSRGNLYIRRFFVLTVNELRYKTLGGECLCKAWKLGWWNIWRNMLKCPSSFTEIVSLHSSHTNQIDKLIFCTDVFLIFIKLFVICCQGNSSITFSKSCLHAVNIIRLQLFCFDLYIDFI
mgnify:CR=1 FL=1